MQTEAFIDRPLCGCGKRPVTVMQGRALKKCYACLRPHMDSSNPLSYGRKRIQKQKKLHPCPCCGKLPVHVCQLNVDHIDGNNQNHVAENLQTICVYCHNLKTYIQNYPKNWLKYCLKMGFTHEAEFTYRYARQLQFETEDRYGLPV